MIANTLPLKYKTRVRITHWNLSIFAKSLLSLCVSQQMPISFLSTLLYLPSIAAINRVTGLTCYITRMPSGNNFSHIQSNDITCNYENAEWHLARDQYTIPRSEQGSLVIPSLLTPACSWYFARICMQVGPTLKSAPLQSLHFAFGSCSWEILICSLKRYQHLVK